MKQIELPFAESEGSHAERWNNLGLALLRIPRKHQKAELAQLVRWVFNVTHGGRSGCLTKSHPELGEWPWGLCCSAATAKRMAAIAQRFGLLLVKDQRRWDGSQQPNAYSINWEGVHSLIVNGRTEGQPDPTPGQPDPTPGQPDPTPGQPDPHIRNYSLIQSSVRKNSGTGPEAGPNPRMGSVSTEASALAAALCAGSPILAAARGRRVAPLPAGGLLHGVFRPLTGRDVAEPRRLVKWHRQQLSAAAPVMGDSEADLLLTLATALYAASIPTAEVQKTRIGAFVCTLRFKRWERSVPFVPQARVLLDEAIRHLGAGWAGLAEETAPAAVVELEASA